MAVGVETSPVLWGDPLWAALIRAHTALEDNPSILREKKPEWERGLNSETINRLCAEAGLGEGVVFEFGDEREGDSIVTRFMIVHHPGPPDSIQVTTWSRYGVRSSASKVDRILGYLQAWMDAREQDLPSSEEESSLEVLARLDRDTPELDKSSGDWVRSGEAAEITDLQVATLGKYRSKGLMNSSKRLGEDTAGRIWRREGTKSAHVWYLRSSLEKN